MQQNQVDLIENRAAVLALARAGATGFAFAEYERYGLDEISDLGDAVLLEDIMSLGGRLYKDLALAHSGKKRLDYALKSAARYKEAFQKTGGYYSGVNTATMSLIAGASDEIVRTRATALLEALPEPTASDRETKYYIEATRAEAHYLLGKMGEASAALKQAVEHDPMNYTAHATTLKQLQMIAAYRGDDRVWTAPFCPPRAAHFAGHMFAVGDVPDKKPTLTQAQCDKLALDLSDTIQSAGIGYGYGALAAGSDIVIAEVLLAEGCDLHVVLPVANDLFIAHSVAPYGAQWVKRFQTCIKKAKTVTIATTSPKWSDAAVDAYAGRIAMGRARLHAGFSTAQAAQLLIWDGLQDGSATAREANEWQASSNGESFVLPYPGDRPVKKPSAGSSAKISIYLAIPDQEPQAFETFDTACRAAFKNRSGDDLTLKQSLHCSFEDDDQAKKKASALAELALPGAILVSESAAALLALENPDYCTMDDLGTLDDSARVYALRPLGLN